MFMRKNISFNIVIPGKKMFENFDKNHRVLYNNSYLYHRLNKINKKICAYIISCAPFTKHSG